MKRQDLVAAALQDRGAAELFRKSTRYRVFQFPGRPWFLYLGRAGAVRRGGTIARSVPVADSVKDELARHGRAVLNRRPA